MPVNYPLGFPELNDQLAPMGVKFIRLSYKDWGLYGMKSCTYYLTENYNSQRTYLSKMNNELYEEFAADPAGKLDLGLLLLAHRHQRHCNVNSNTYKKSSTDVLNLITTEFTDKKIPHIVDINKKNKCGFFLTESVRQPELDQAAGNALEESSDKAAADTLIAPASGTAALTAAAPAPNNSQKLRVAPETARRLPLLPRPAKPDAPSGSPTLVSVLLPLPTVQPEVATASDAIQLLATTAAGIGNKRPSEAPLEARIVSKRVFAHPQGEIKF